MKLNIAISSLTFDRDGARILRQHGSAYLDNRQGARRVMRVATLDGGAELYDTGYSAADRTIRVITDAENIDWLERMCKEYSLVRVVTQDGVYIGCPSAYDMRNGRARLEILVKQEDT